MGFEALEVAVEMVSVIRPVVEKIQSRKATDLADQLRRAVESVVLNLGESRWRRGRDRTNRFGYAGGSAEEAKAAVRTAIGWGYITADDARCSLAYLDRILAMTFRLMNPRPKPTSTVPRPDGHARR
jgi:four helix bundle protein